MCFENTIYCALVARVDNSVVIVRQQICLTGTPAFSVGPEDAVLFVVIAVRIGQQFVLITILEIRYFL